MVEETYNPVVLACGCGHPIITADDEVVDESLTREQLVQQLKLEKAHNRLLHMDI